MQEYRTIRQQLMDRYSEIQTRLQKITRDMQRKKEPLSPDFSEQAVQRENDEVLDALDNSIRTEMAQISETLERLDKGQYGTCMICGIAIPLARLEALPHTSRCVTCAEQSH